MPVELKRNLTIQQTEILCAEIIDLCKKFRIEKLYYKTTKLGKRKYNFEILFLDEVDRE